MPGDNSSSNTDWIKPMHINPFQFPDGYFGFLMLKQQR